MKKSSKQRRVFGKKISKKVVATNYIGGLGYYFLLFGWAFFILIMLLGVSQFILKDGVSTDTVHASVMQAEGTKGQSSGFLWSVLLSVPIVLSVAVIVLLLPYFIGQYFQRIPRWIIDNSSMKRSHDSMLRIKIISACLLFAVTLVGLFGFDKDIVYNLPSFLIYGCAILSVVLFIFQYLLVKVWHLSYKDIF